MPVEVLKCPSCGAPLDNVAELTRCPYCNAVIQVHIEKPGSISPSMSPNPEGAKLATAISEMYHKGLKIQAIKLYRELTNEGFQQAKDTVESLAGNPNQPDVWNKLHK